MQREYVASTNIASIGYDEASETLEVEFLNSSVYQYYNIPPNLYEELLRDGSKGSFLNTYIKNNYAYSRV
jgi:hypothetical protein